MSLFDFLPYVIALGIAAAIPGPGIAACVGKALGSGFSASLLFHERAGAGRSDLSDPGDCGAFRRGPLFSEIFVVIKFAGAAYLLWLAWTFWRAGIDPAKMHAAQGAGFWPSFVAGFSITMGNPKTIIFYMALLPTVVDLQTITVQRYGVLVLLTIIVLYCVVTPYILLASRARAFLRNPRALRWLNRSAATAMAGAATFILLRE